MSIFNKPNQCLYLSSGNDYDNLASCTHLAIGAHPDDLEIMAFHGIAEGQKKGQSFVGVVCCDGAGSPQGTVTIQDIIQVRQQEQIQAAKLGEYLACAMLAYPSRHAKAKKIDLKKDLKTLLEKSQPKVIYTHNPMDKHLTHVAISRVVVEVLRELNFQPERFYGCEVWRGLDWVSENLKISLPIESPKKMEQLIEVFKSQTGPGKNYTQATLGRCYANATYNQSHSVDQFQAVTYAIDMLPLLGSKMSFESFCQTFITQLHVDVDGHLKSLEESS